MSGIGRAAVIVVAIVAVVVAFLALRPGASEDDGRSGTTGTATTTGQPSAQGQATTTQTQTQEPAPPAPVFKTITVVGGRPQGGVRKVSFEKGDRVRLRVRSDTADEIHIHGYDLAKDVAAGGQVRFSFPASIEGRFEIELEHAGVQIATLEVAPS
jgi:hypothetical protein